MTGIAGAGEGPVPARTGGSGCRRAASYGSFGELAAAERIDRSYLGKRLRLTLLAPDIVEAILDGRQSCDLCTMSCGFRVPNLWAEQRSSMAETSGCASSAA